MTRRLARSVVATTASRIAVEVLVAALLTAVAAGVLVIAGRPEAWDGGVGFVTRTVLAIAGTSAVGLLLAGGLLAGFLLRGTLVRSGALDGLASQGRGPRDLLLVCAPLLVTFAAAMAATAFVVEPVAWTEIHGVKGSPAASASVLGRLGRGELVSLPDGAAVELPSGLQIKVGERTATVGDFSADGAGWILEDVAVHSIDAQWSASTIRLIPLVQPSPPASPWTRGWSAGRLEGREPGRMGRRASLVWHRRHALVVLAPMIAICGFGLGQRRRGRWHLARVAAFGAWVFLALRLCDRAAASGLLPGVVAGWLPLVALVVLLPMAGRLR